MLFDLKGKRKRLVQVVYVTLAILFGGGLVLFGVGGNVSGGLSTPSSGDGQRGHDRSSATAWSAPSAARRADPDDAEARLALVRAAATASPHPPEGSDAETGALTDRGQQAIIEVAQAWERYLRLKPEKIDSERRRVRGARIRGAAGLRQGRGDAAARRSRPGRARTATSSSPTSPTARGRSRQGDACRQGGGPAHPARPAQHRALADQGHEEAGRADREGARGSQEGRAAAAEGRGEAAEPGQTSARCPGQRPAHAAPRRSARSTARAAVPIIAARKLT